MLLMLLVTSGVLWTVAREAVVSSKVARSSADCKASQRDRGTKLTLWAEEGCFLKKEYEGSVLSAAEESMLLSNEQALDSTAVPDPIIIHNAAISFDALHKTLEAEATLTSEIRLFPDLWWLRLDHSFLLQRLGRRAEAVSELIQALRARPRLAESLTKENVSGLRTNPRTMLLQAYNLSSCGRAPNTATMLAKCGELEFFLGRRSAAKEHILAALARNPRLPVGWYVLSRIFTVEGEKNEARLYSNRAAILGYKQDSAYVVTDDVNVARYRFGLSVDYIIFRKSCSTFEYGTATICLKQQLPVTE